MYDSVAGAVVGSLCQAVTDGKYTPPSQLLRSGSESIGIRKRNSALDYQHFSQYSEKDILLQTPKLIDDIVGLS